MTKRKHPLVDVQIEKRLFPDRTTGYILGPPAYDRVDVLLEIAPDPSKRERIAPMQAKGGLPGQLWRGRIRRRHAGKAEVDLEKLLVPSPLEVPPACELAPFCGGCNYQNLRYETELLLKSRQMQDLYRPIFAGPLSIRKSPLVQGYRNKMEYSFGDLELGGPLTLGLHRPKHYYDILPTPHCLLVPEDFNTIRAAVQDYCRKKGWDFYHKSTKQGFLRHLVLRAALTTKQILVNLVTSSALDFAQEKEDFVAFLRSLPLQFSLVSVFHTTNDRTSDAVVADRLELLWGQAYLEEELFGLTFRPGPFSFFQPNVFGAIQLYQEAMDLAGDLSGKTVYDLYSGTGTLSQIAAQKAQRVIGVEIVEEAVAAAQASAERNGLANVKFVARDVLEELGKLAQAGERPDLVLLDPPRQGVHPKAIGHLLAAGPEKIVYISCNPKTHVRDLQLFQDGGYQIASLSAFDQFPRTKHVETIVLMSREG